MFRSTFVPTEHEYYQYAHRLRVDPEGNGDFETIKEACDEAELLLAALGASDEIGIEVNANFGYREAFDVPERTTIYPSTGGDGYGPLGGSGNSGQINIRVPASHFLTNDYVIGAKRLSTIKGLALSLTPVDVPDIETAGNDVFAFKCLDELIWFDGCSVLGTTLGIYNGTPRITGWYNPNSGLNWGLGHCKGFLSGNVTHVRSDDSRLILRSCDFYGFFDIGVDIRMDGNNSQLVDCRIGTVPAEENNATWVIANSGTTHAVIASNTRIPKDKWQPNGNGFGRINLHPTLWQDGTINDFGELSLEVLGYTPKVIRVTSDYIVTRSDTTILVDASAGDVTIELPQILVGFNRREYDIKKIDSSVNVVNIVGAVPFNRIDGAVTHTLNYQYSSITVQAYREGGFGSGWWIV